MAKFVLVLAAVWLTGCARAHLAQITVHHPAHPAALQAPTGERSTALEPPVEQAEPVAAKKAEPRKGGGHSHHGH